MVKPNRLLPLVAALAAALFLAGSVQAASFTWYASGFHSQSDASATDPAGTTDYTHPDVGWDTENTDSARNATRDDIGTDAFGRAETTLEEGYLNILVEGMASGGRTPDAEGVSGWAYGNANTVAPAQTTGIFFQITADEGEQDGDQVMVHLNWYTEMMSTGAGSQAVIDSGYATNRDIAVTINDTQAPETYDPAKVVWSYGYQEISGDNGFSNGVEDTFMATIGDIIGIHMGASGSIDISGEESPEYTEAMAYQNIELITEPLTSEVPVPGASLLLASGLIGLSALRRRP